MGKYFTTMFLDFRHERSLILLISLTEPDSLTQSKFTDYEINFLENLALGKLQIQRVLKEYAAAELLQQE